eukprot:836776-Amphidinium_carterae.1
MDQRKCSKICCLSKEGFGVVLNQGGPSQRGCSVSKAGISMAHTLGQSRVLSAVSCSDDILLAAVFRLWSDFLLAPLDVSARPPLPSMKAYASLPAYSPVQEELTSMC